ncbi:hypothetical protein AAFC00_001510 [Neodothiora populina]|uniref:Mitochondrial pyruvate carrier n=1 Tax=Neodothiora populina TaxID=2781224 RepID=A0ABR3PPE2_9PEZI
MSQRAGLRFFNTLRQSAFGKTFSQTQKRTYAEAAETVAPPAPAQSKMNAFWNSKVGPKTVHFWAPIMKWGLVIAGAADFARPAEALSLSQNAALMATGLIWTRWCFIIKPRNVFLASVNFCLFLVGMTQTARVLLYRSSLKNESVGREIESAAKAEGQRVQQIVKDPKGAVERAEKV